MSVDSTAIIHPSAVVSDGATIAARTSIGPFSVVGPHVTIGEDCRIGSHAVLAGRTTLGKKNIIYQFASVGAEPQDLKYHNEPSELLLGDENTIREYVTLQPGTEGGGMVTSIGSKNLFMACSHVGHDAKLGSSNVIANSAAVSGHVQIGDYVTVGGLVGIHQFVRVGSYAFLGAGAMVAQDIPPFCLAQGDRAELYGLNIIGLRRRGFKAEDIRQLKESFRALFYQGGKLKEKINTIRETAQANTSQYVEELLQFIESSERGIASTTRTDEEE